MSLSGRISLPKLPRRGPVTNIRRPPARLRRRRSPPARPISPSRPSWSAKPSSTAFCDRRLAGLVVDDREAAVGSRSMRSAGHAPGPRREPSRPSISALSGRRPAALVFALQGGNPVDRLEQPRRPQGAQHRVDRLVLQQPLGARPELVRVAFVVLAASPRTPRGPRCPSSGRCGRRRAGRRLRSLRIACA